MIIFVIEMINIIYALISGFLLAFSWPDRGFVFFIFFSFVPFFFLEERISNSVKRNKELKIFFCSVISFLIFNVITTYWVYHATLFGAIAAFIVNTLLMSLTFLLFHKVKSYTNNRIGFVFFISVWISMEFIHLNWDLSWPWLTLGNVFANIPNIIQWYEFTGVLGGSFWILFINWILYKLLTSRYKKNLLGLVILVFFLPLMFSYYLLNNIDLNQRDNINVVVLQPNINPYTEKFSIDSYQQLKELISLARNSLTDNTDLLLCPETSFQESIWENKIELSQSVMLIRKLQLDYPNLNVIAGATTYKFFLDDEDKTPTARKFKNSDSYYDIYNSAILIPDSGKVMVYHKTKLVPGAEKIPFPAIFNNVSALSVDLGGVSGSLGSDNSLYSFNLSKMNILPMICYESIYGDLITNKEKNIMCIITNDGWWKDTPGYRQHFAYARMRAIEQRKSIIRSANTGISGVINSKGEVLYQTNWNEKIAFSSNVLLNNKETFYNKYGDYIGRINSFVAILIILITFSKKAIQKTE